MKWWLAGLLVACLTSAASADTPLRVARSDQRMRVDGSLREWRGARFATLGSGEGSLSYALAHRDGGLYVAARVQDAQVVRGRGLGKGQDALVLTFAMPDRAGRWVGTEVWLHPGVPGSAAAAAGIGAPGARPKPAAKVTVVEGPGEGEGGYVLEAFVPWGALRESDLWQMGRASLRYVNANRPGRGDVSLHTAPGRRLGELPPLASGEGEVDALAQFLKAQALMAAEPEFDLKGQVYGDRVAERVTVVRGFVVVSGPSIGDGTSFAYTKLPLGAGGSVKSAKLSDMTGDGRAELLVTMRQKNSLGQRTVWGVVQLSEGPPALVFGVETAKSAGGGSVEATLEVQSARGGQPASIVVERGSAQGVDAASFREARAGDVEPILLPWESVRRRVYRYDGGRFQVVDEQRDPETTSKEDSGRSPQSSPNEAAASAPVPPSQAALLAAARKAVGLSASAKPDRTLSANFAGDGQNEQLWGYGEHLMLVGPGIGAGQGYLVHSVPLRQGEELRTVEAADVTADGRAEILVRVRQPLGPEGLAREVLLVQQVTGQGISRLLAVEVTRTMGAQRIDNRVHTKDGTLRIEAGSARGWSAGNYPFPDEPVGGVGRLLLPWRDRRPLRYRLVQGKLQP